MQVRKTWDITMQLMKTGAIQENRGQTMQVRKLRDIYNAINENRVYECKLRKEKTKTI